MNTANHLSEPRVYASGSFEAEIDPSSLAPGTFTFIARPRFDKEWLFSNLFFYPAMACLANSFPWLIWVNRARSELASSYLCQILIFCPAAIYSIRKIYKTIREQRDILRFPPMKFVFYQPGYPDDGLPYRTNVQAVAARYEVHFRGTIKETGFLTQEKLWMWNHLDAHETNLAVERDSSIRLNSSLDPDSLPFDDPFRKEHESSYVVYRGRTAEDVPMRLAELRSFLGLQLESNADVDWTTDAAQKIIDREQKKSMKRQKS